MIPLSGRAGRPGEHHPENTGKERDAPVLPLSLQLVRIAGEDQSRQTGPMKPILDLLHDPVKAWPARWDGPGKIDFTGGPYGLHRLREADTILHPSADLVDVWGWLTTFSDPPSPTTVPCLIIENARRPGLRVLSFPDRQFATLARLVFGADVITVKDYRDAMSVGRPFVPR